MPNPNAFPSDQALVNFAKSFLKDRIGDFRKDLAICMTRDADGHHAYFPTLITCIAFLDLLSGLYAGTLEGHGFADLQKYVSRFMESNDYKHLDFVYEMFRHKIAHLAYPYAVFDTKTKPKVFGSQKQRRVTWTVFASNRTKVIEIIDYPGPRTLMKARSPWTVTYDSRVLISLPMFQADITNSVRGPTGYLRHLATDPQARYHFTRCMNLYFPS